MRLWHDQALFKEPGGRITDVYFADGCTRGSDRPHFAVDRPAIAIGAPITSDVTPIAFPADGLPATPADGAVPRRRGAAGR